MLYLHQSFSAEYVFAKKIHTGQYIIQAYIYHSIVAPRMPAFGASQLYYMM